jgi:hypothetical protein
MSSNPAAPTTLKWYEIFVPENDPDTPQNESDNRKVIRACTWAAPAGGGETPEYTIDPTKRSDGDGNYYMAFPPRLGGYNYGNSYYYSWLDPQEKITNGLTIQKANIGTSDNPQNGYQTSFWLSLSGVTKAKYTFSWLGQGITVILTGIYDSEGNWTERKLHNGEILTEEELANTSFSFYLRVDPSLMTTAFAEVKVAATDGAGTSLGEDTIKAKFLPELMVDANRDGQMSFDDQAIRNADWTGQWWPYRFWVNDDDDSGDKEHPGSTLKDSYFDITSKRDLEDYTRLWINVTGLQKGLADGTLKLGLRW